MFHSLKKRDSSKKKGTKKRGGGEGEKSYPSQMQYQSQPKGGDSVQVIEAQTKGEESEGTKNIKGWKGRKKISTQRKEMKLFLTRLQAWMAQGEKGRSEDYFKKRREAIRG